MRQRARGDASVPDAPPSAAPQLMRDSLGSVDRLMAHIAATSLAFCVVAGTAGPHGLLAQQPAPAVPVALEFAVTGGSWQADSSGGQYRVLVLTGGFEHIVSEFHLQWVRDPSMSDSAAVIRSVPIDEVNGVSRAQTPPTIQHGPAGTRITIALIDSHRPGAAGRMCVVTPGPPGRYTIACAGD